MKRQAYTLIEVMVVLTLLGLLMGIAAVRLVPVWRHQQKLHAAQEILFAEEQLRDLCRRSDEPGLLVYELGSGGLSLQRGGLQVRRVSAAGGLELSGLMQGHGEVSTRGIVEVPVTRQGTTPTYALQMNQEDISNWIVFAGLSGQKTTLNQDDEVRTLFQTLGAHAP